MSTPGNVGRDGYTPQATSDYLPVNSPKHAAYPTALPSTRLNAALLKRKPQARMSRDSSHTYIHMHSPSHADLFEDFCRPPSTTTPSTNTNSNSNLGSDPSLQNLPGSFLPFESINLPPHLQPINPEDEDDVVPDMHAAFGIMRALGREGERGVAAEPVWRDLGLGTLVDGNKKEVGSGAKREGKRTGLLLMR